MTSSDENGGHDYNYYTYYCYYIVIDNSDVSHPRALEPRMVLNYASTQGDCIMNKL